MRKENNNLSIRPLDIKDPGTAQEVWSIQIPAYKAEAELIQFWDLPPLKETVASLRECGETFYGGFINAQLVGAVSFKSTEQELDIHRLMVHPHFFRQGIARALIQHIEQLAADKREMIVSTGTDNAPAVQFYKQCGFKEVKKITTVEGLSLTFFAKEKGQP
ncbi:MAG TPA: GNAT family N-acetyltransferase [Pseudobacillus sp.]